MIRNYIPTAHLKKTGFAFMYKVVKHQPSRGKEPILMDKPAGGLKPQSSEVQEKWKKYVEACFSKHGAWWQPADALPAPKRARRDRLADVSAKK